MNTLALEMFISWHMLKNQCKYLRTAHKWKEVERHYIFSMTWTEAGQTEVRLVKYKHALRFHPLTRTFSPVGNVVSNGSLHSSIPVVSLSEPPLHGNPSNGEESSPNQSDEFYFKQITTIKTLKAWREISLHEEHSFSRLSPQSTIIKFILLAKFFRFTWAFKYRRKKSSRKDFPFRKAPATDTTTTFLSRTRSSSNISVRAPSSKSNEWSSVATTTWTGFPFNLLPLAETVE